MYTPFFTPVWRKSIALDFEHIANKCLRLEDGYPSAHISNEGGYQSQLINLEEHFPEIGDAISTPMSEIANEALLNIFLSEVWVNINRNGHFNTAHVHPNNVLSAVIYIRTPQDCGKIIFENPTLAEHYPVDKNNQLFMGKFWVQPNPGDMIIFPSYLKHSVEMNKSNDPRISIALNFKMQ
jgi:uncharacterized protein (TIGR02466 family)